MRIDLLGTGSADGWPNPFCRCTSCETERADGQARRPSAALVDGVVLIDCGPTTAHLPAGSTTTLADVEHVLVTHGHPDHLHPAFLLSRSWTAPTRTLHVWGPPLAIEMCAPWVGPGAAVELHTVAAGQSWPITCAAGEYRVTALPASHAHGDGDVMALEALLFLVEDPTGGRLLYATDTGPLPASTLASVGGRVDVVLLDETFGDRSDHGTGHLDLSRLPGVLEDFRTHRIVDERTKVGATHLSHHNPPSRMLRGRLAEMGVRLMFDGDALDTRGDEHRAERTLLIGGARSGKSTAAESIAGAYGDVVYVATGGDRNDDAEWVQRVAAHRARRPSHWRTVETLDIAAALDEAPRGTAVLVDCIALWLTGVLDGMDAWSRCERGDGDGVRRDVETRIDAVVASLRACAATVIIVTNEVGMGVVPDTAGVRLFRDLLGVANARMGAACDRMLLVVAGRMLPLSPQAQPATKDQA